MKIHLVDGTFELFRCFYGAPRHSDASGCEVGAVRGLIHTLVALLRKPDVTHVAVAFDQMSTRVNAGDRASDSALLKSQYMLSADAVRALGIVFWPMYRFQADDALASGAKRYRGEPGVTQIVLCTTDKDLLQCVVGDEVVVLDRVRKVTHAEIDVVKRFGVPPSVLPAFFALVGDPSDGLPGVPHWGAKAAGVVLDRYRSIEAIPDNEDVWDVSVRGAARLAASLRDRRREALLMRNLCVRRNDVPLADGVADLEWGGASRGTLEPIAERVDVGDVLERVPKWA